MRFESGEEKAGLCIFIFFITLLIAISYGLYNSHLEIMQKTDRCFELLTAIYDSNSTYNDMANQQIEQVEKIPFTKVQNLLLERCLEQ